MRTYSLVVALLLPVTLILAFALSLYKLLTFPPEMVIVAAGASTFIVFTEPPETRIRGSKFCVSKLDTVIL